LVGQGVATKRPNGTYLLEIKVSKKVMKAARG
jgi:hypothetical protein